MKWLLQSLLLILLAGLGWWAGRTHGRGKISATTSDTTPRSSPGMTGSQDRLKGFAWQDRALGSDALAAFCADEVPLSEIPAMLAQLGPYADPMALEILFRRWTEADPKAAVAFFEHFDLTDRNRDNIGNTILATWSQLDAPAAAAYALAEIDRGGSRFDWDHLWKTLAHADGAAAFAKGLHSLVEMDGIFSEWVQQDLPAATAALAKLPPGTRLEQAAYEVLDAQVALDPVAALAFLRGLPDSTRAAIGMYKLKGRYQLAPPEVRFSMLGEQLLNFGHADGISTQLRALRKLDEAAPERGQTFTGLFTALEGEVGGDLRSWASKDAAGALAWAAQFPDAHLRPVLAGTFAQELIHTGQIATGLNALQSLPEATQVEIVTRAGKDAKPDLATQFPPGALRDAFLKGIGAAQAEP